MSEKPFKIAVCNALVPCFIAILALAFWLSLYGKKLAEKLNFKVEKIQKNYESSLIDSLVSLDLRLGLTYIAVLAITTILTIFIVFNKIGVKRNGIFTHIINSLFNTCTNITTFYSLFFALSILLSSDNILKTNFTSAFLYIVFGLGALFFAISVNFIIEYERKKFSIYICSIKNPKTS